MTKIEEVARAIKAELGKQDFIMDYGDDDSIKEVVVDGCFDLTAVAIVAVSAMKDSTFGMIAEGMKKNNCYDSFDAMIDAALAEQAQP